MTTIVSKQRARGARDFALGKLQTENPYKLTGYRRAWSAGWCEANHAKALLARWPRGVVRTVEHVLADMLADPKATTPALGLLEAFDDIKRIASSRRPRRR